MDKILCPLTKRLSEVIQSILFSDNEMLPPKKDSDLHFVASIILLVQTSTGHLVPGRPLPWRGWLQAYVCSTSKTWDNYGGDLLFRACITLYLLPTTPLVPSLNRWKIFGLGSGRSQGIAMGKKHTDFSMLCSIIQKRR